MPKRLVLTGIKPRLVRADCLSENRKLPADPIAEMKTCRPRQDYDVRSSHCLHRNFLGRDCGFGDVRFIVGQRENDNIVLAVRVEKQRRLGNRRHPTSF